MTSLAAIQAHITQFKRKSNEPFEAAPPNTCVPCNENPSGLTERSRCRIPPLPPPEGRKENEITPERETDACEGGLREVRYRSNHDPAELNLAGAQQNLDDLCTHVFGHTRGIEGRVRLVHRDQAWDPRVLARKGPGLSKL